MKETYTLKDLQRDIKERAGRGLSTGVTILYKILSSNSGGVSVLRTYHFFKGNVAEHCNYDSNSQAKKDCIENGLENLVNLLSPLAIYKLSSEEGKTIVRIKNQ